MMLNESYRCWAEIDLGALRANLAWIRHRVGPQVKIMTVVKADAYGHGLKQIAALLMQSGADLFGVANLVEAEAIRSVGKGWPILLLGACLPWEVSLAVQEGVMPTISSWEEARRFADAGQALRRTVAVHIKVDTGMGRLGVAPAEAVGLATRVAQLPWIKIEGVYTHFASAEDDSRFTRGQRKIFEVLLFELRARGIQIPTVHACNSGALVYDRAAPFNLVRPGLLVYGVIPPGTRRLPALWKRRVRPALSLKCRVSFVKTIRAGTPLSYGRSFVARTPMRVATVSAGYGDGYLRAAGNRAEVLIGGRRCALVGRVTMDQMMVDVSGLSEARTGDEVVLIGGQGNHEITANEVAAWCGTVPWEVLTNVSYRVTRLYRGSEAA